MTVEERLQQTISAWTIEDFQAIADAGISETIQLEFKQDFSNGNEEQWRKTQKEISRKSRDELASEIVAFANAFGGTLLLGIAEDKHENNAPVSAGLGPPIPNVGKCAARLNDSLNAIVDPPLQMLVVKAIEDREASGSGYIAIHVPQSLSAPHGIGTPSRAYVRRGASCMPMTMRELHNVFWEARSSIERVEKRIEQMQDLFIQKSNLINSATPPNVLSFKFFVVPERHMEIARPPDIFKGGGEFEFRLPDYGPIAPGQRKLTEKSLNWRPTAGGVFADFVKKLGDHHCEVRLSVVSDGTIIADGVFNRPDSHVSRPYAYCASWLLHNSIRLRRYLGRPDVPLIVGGEMLVSPGTSFRCQNDPDEHFASSSAGPAHMTLDRLSVYRDDEEGHARFQFAEQIAWAFGLRGESFPGLTDEAS